MTIRIPYAFAESGDANAIPDTPSTTEVSWSQGYTAAYELADTEAGYRYVERDENNYILNSLSGNVKQWQEKTYPEWFSDIAYTKNSIFVYDVDGEIYICTDDADAGALPTNTDYFSTLDDFYASLLSAENLTGTIPSARLPLATTTNVGAVELATLSEIISGEAGKIPDSSVLLDILFPAGEIKTLAMPSPITRTLECNGSEISRTEYPRLFSAIGTAYGVGNGSTTFNIPDFRGEFLRGWDDGRGVDDGREFGDWQKASIAFFNTGTDTAMWGLSSDSTESSGEIRGKLGYDDYDSSNYSGAGVGTTGQDKEQLPGDFGSTGGSGAIRPRNVAVMYVITY